MELTLTHKLLIYGLTQFRLSEETQMAIFHAMAKEEDRIQMIAFLKKNPEATEQEILDEAFRICGWI